MTKEENNNIKSLIQKHLKKLDTEQEPVSKILYNVYPYEMNAIHKAMQEYAKQEIRNFRIQYNSKIIDANFHIDIEDVIDYLNSKK